jgi:hypothetical protein
MSVPSLPARDLLTDAQILLPAQTTRVANPLIYTNALDLGDTAFNRWLHWCNVARALPQSAVLLGQYEPGTCLHGAGPFAIWTSGALVEEQAPAEKFDSGAVWQALSSTLNTALDVNRPCLLACRHGEWTWGHWLLDMLPKIVLAEHFMPQRFTYVVPGGITQPGSTRFHIRSVLSSLAAYGIEPSRLLRIRHDATYRFQSLFDIADIVDDGFHPGALLAMRNVQGVAEGPRRNLTAVMRPRDAHRPICNANDIGSLLLDHGAKFVDPTAASFAEQVAAFRDSDIVAGDLGSNLAAAIFAQPGTGLLTLAPCGWHDSYFVNIFQRLAFFHADVRGASMSRPDVGHAPHAINPASVAVGLQAIQAARTEPLGAPVVSGRMIARTPGTAAWEIWFGAHGNAQRFQDGAFGAPESHGTWSLGASCLITVPDFGAPAIDYWLEIQGVGFIARPHLLSRTLGITINGTWLAEFDIDELTHIHVAVPGALLARSSTLSIQFHHPICPSPRDMGVSSDTRNLGFMFERLALLAA